MEYKDIFPILLSYKKLDKILADSLEERFLPWLEKLQLDGSYADHRHSDYWEQKIPVGEIAPELIEEFILAFRDYAEKTDFKIDEAKGLDIWTQDYQEGEGHDMHGHGSSGISGVYWVRANENAGSLRFYNPNQIAELVPNTNPNNFYTVGQAEVPVEKGGLLLFPSYLKHKVVIDGENAVRTTIAVNISE